MSKYGLLNSYRLYKSDGSKFCLVIPTEAYFSVLGYGPYYKKFDGVYKWSEFEVFKKEHDVYTSEELSKQKYE
ncbi:hypothetical protein [Staphylococcus americanisciuri]|uniref:Phage protein n=1 Tax=Staphylococcus americanisciuri TaxID=2973940 RepID=A0ABT2F1X5_9STAP|nr:hypothetical protein [Staphylococcus americanisciuri]MCS4486362.1 hypothetical protein [Staphylococcus americanisciuri]